MNIVIIKHEGCHRRYIFSVPEGQKLKKGEVVLVRNSRGEKTGTCCCDSFDCGNALEEIITAYGGTRPLAPVIGKMGMDKWEEKGRWIIRNKGQNNWYECSRCNTVGSPFWKRCPVCEAKMEAVV